MEKNTCSRSKVEQLILEIVENYMVNIEIKKGYARKTIDNLENAADYIASSEAINGDRGPSNKCLRMGTEAQKQKEELIAYIETLEDYFAAVNLILDKTDKIKEKTLKEAHTRILMSWLSKARACGGGYNPFDDNSEFGFSIGELKIELSKREHIPNKQEAKTIRQQKAKEKRNR